MGRLIVVALFIPFLVMCLLAHFMGYLKWYDSYS